MEPRIIIRHVGKAQRQADEFSAASFSDLTFGRDPACQVHYDETGEIVSRRHAKLALAKRDPVELVLTDLGSRNGTFVNGKRIDGPTPVSAGDRVQLGNGGPEFEIGVAGAGGAETADVARRGAPTRLVEPAPAGRAGTAPAAAAGLRAGLSSLPAPALLRWGGAALVALGLVLTGIWASGRHGGVLDVKIYNQQTIMTVAYKAYGNPDAAGGRYWFAKVVMKNTGTDSVKNVRASFQIPDYIPWTTPDEAPEVLPGQTIVWPIYPKLPPRVSSVRTRTPSQIEIKIEYDDGTGVKTKIEKRQFEFRGVTEFEWTSLPASEAVGWFDVWDNHPLSAAYVTDEDPVVKTFLAKVSESCGGTTIIDNGQQLADLGKCIYDYMVSLGMTYSGDKGVPERIGDVSAVMQSIRLPRDVIYGNSGLCIELALLWCAIGEAAGLDTEFVLIPGHAFPIIQSNDGTRIAVEATSLGGAAAAMPNGAVLSFAESTKMAAKELSDAQQDGRILFVNIKKFQDQGIRPPELADVDQIALRKMLDELVARHSGRHPAARQAGRGNQGSGQ